MCDSHPASLAQGPPEAAPRMWIKYNTMSVMMIQKQPWPSDRLPSHKSVKRGREIKASVRRGETKRALTIMPLRKESSWAGLTTSGYPWVAHLWLCLLIRGRRSLYECLPGSVFMSVRRNACIVCVYMCECTNTPFPSPSSPSLVSVLSAAETTGGTSSGCNGPFLKGGVLCS